MQNQKNTIPHIIPTTTTTPTIETIKTTTEPNTATPSNYFEKTRQNQDSNNQPNPVKQSKTYRQTATPQASHTTCQTANDALALNNIGTQQSYRQNQP